jgi:hypothetical protein
MNSPSRRNLPLGGWLILAALPLILIVSAVTAPVNVTVEWSTASELNTAGFNLYRGDSREGPFTRINPELISASTDPLVGGSYVYTDNQVSPGRTYYYQLEEVETSGRTNIQGTQEVAVGGLNFLWLAVAAASLVVAGFILWRSRRPAAPPLSPHE